MRTVVSPQQLFQHSFIEAMKDVYTSVPGHIIAFDAKSQRAQVQTGVQRVDINGVSFDVPPVIDVPVSIYGSADFIVEVEINPGCEGMILFSQRCIDGWKQTGGSATNPLTRFHSMQDAMFVPGIRSLAGAISGYSNDGIRLRDKTGGNHVWLRRDGTIVSSNGKSTITQKPDGSVTMTNGTGNFEMQPGGNVVINGVTITVDGRITAPPGGGIEGANGVSFENHKHGGVQTGSGTTGGPVK
ncbi:baseplate spike [Edwardsiella phage PEi21]|uniref:Putative baseplate protein n=1 Tax=Edwardsiella phage PEi21 TaxID=1325372 RepID=N0DPE2_9CAUD|nr:baseplate spike [Edwardsiella phage PEi21]BAN16850.1 putative baseplate protein [Edwardsiella phage PEi21]